MGRPRPKSAVAKLDDLENVLTGLGQADRDTSKSTRIVASTLITQDEVDALYQDNPIAAAIVDLPAEDATRRGVDLTIEGEDDASRLVLDKIEDLDGADKITDLIRIDRKDGGGLLLLDVDDGAVDLTQPLDLATIRSLRDIYLIERAAAQVSEWEINGKPKTFTIAQGKSSTQAKVHASRVIALYGLHVSDRVRQTQGGWGLSALQRPRQSLVSYDEAWGYVQATFKRFTETIVKISGLTTLLAADKDAVVRKRLQLMNLSRSALKALVIDKEEDVAENGISFSGIAELMLRLQDRVASSARMPLTKLFGHSPAGLSTDDKPGSENYDDTVASIQARKLVRVYNVLVEVICAAKDGPTAGRVPERWQVTPRPLRQPTDEELSTRRLRDAQTAQILILNNVLDPDEVRESLRAQPGCPYIIEDGPLAEDKPEPTP